MIADDKKARGKLIVVSGPSGAGKSTIIGMVMNQRSDLCFSVSATTREPRIGEIEGKNYYFVTRERFGEMVADGELLEYAEYVGNLYGTPRKALERQLDMGMSVILDIEVQGANQVKKAMPEAVMIFLIPKNFAELEKRIRSRSLESEVKIHARIERARLEYLLAHNYDYIVINDCQETAADELGSIITAECCRMPLREHYLTI